MDSTEEIRVFLEKFEKKFKLDLEDLNWVERRLDEVYWCGYDNGENGRKDFED